MNPGSDQITDALLGKYLAGEADPAESALVRRWLADSPDHRAEFSRFERIWAGAGSLPAVDTDAAWARVQGQLRNTTADPAPDVRPLWTEPPRPAGPQRLPDSPAVVRPLRPRPPLGWRLAAAVLLVLGAGLLGYRLISTPASEPAGLQRLTVRAGDTPRPLTLPDGSVITLNRNSRLSYAPTFTDTLREVTLTGEAFFAVAPNRERPFVIRAQGTNVRVVGTAFSVRAYSPNVTVTVETGTVIVSRRQQRVDLTRGQQASVDTTADTIRRASRADLNLLAYRSKRLVFANTALADVAQTLSDYYGTEIRLGNARLRNCRLTSRFDNESLDAVLAVLTETLQLQIRRDGTAYVLTGEGCGP